MGPTRLIGRDRQLALLREALVSASAGGARCVLVTGEAGIGKTRLVTEAVAGLDDATVVTGRAVDMSTGEIPFGVLADSLRDLTRTAGQEVLTDAEREALAPLLPGAAPSARLERVQLLSAFVDLLERLASDRLLVWVVEDLHWADSATRDLVNLAARTLRGRFLLVATVRTDDPERSEPDEASLATYVAELARTPGCTVLPLDRLSPDEVHQQLSGLLGSGLSPDVAARIERLSDGVPFVVEELAAGAGRPEVATAAAVASGRLAGLSAEARRLVDAAAVGDGHLRISLVEEVLDATPEELDVALVEAVRAGILVTDAENDALGFRHALLRDATDRAMGPGARRSWHRRWAEVLDDHAGVLAADPAALAVAEHWHHARDVRRALAATVAAMPAAARLCRPEEEVVLWTRIMRGYALLEDAEHIAGLPLREVLVRGAVGSSLAPRGLVRDFLSAVPTEGLTPAERVALRLMAQDDNAKGEANLLPADTAEAAADAFEGEPPDFLSTVVWTRAGSRLHDVERGARLIRRARAAAQELPGPRPLLVVANMGSFHAQVNGDPGGAAALLRDILGQFPDESWQGVLGCLGNLVWCETVQGHHAEAAAVAEDALSRLSHPHLSIEAWEHLVENAAATWLLTGDWARARGVLEEAAPWWVDDVRTSNARLALLDLMQHGTAEVERWRGRADDPAPGGAPRALVRELLARAAAAAGDLSAMRRALAPAWSDPAILFSDDQLWAAALLAARAEADAALAGPRVDGDEALAHLATIEEVAGRFRRYGALGEVWPVDLAAQLDRFHGRDARPGLRAALVGWERIGHVPDAGVTHLSLAEQEAVHGDRGAAREHLAAAREVAARLEARPMLDRADALAARYGLGARERRTEDVLTEREAEVLRLVAEGRTNGQIAADLFMSPKTASVHVSRIITKLGVSNRTEAAAVARRHGLLD